MAKQHHAQASSPQAAAALALTLSSPPSHLSGLLRQDLAKLVDKDPDTRRRAMDALKGYIEGELDVKSMPFFLEQVSGESNRSEASRSHAILLFVEVVRVHKQLAVPYIPRIMTTVVRSLPSAAGHQACAKVVSAVARFAIEPPISGEEVLASLCHPLLTVLCSKVEPVSVGAATCLQALVESEKWKFATPHLERELCHRAAMALGERGTQTVAHMHLVRSLAKFNPEALQEDGAQLLRTGLDILLAAGGNCGPWQQRAAAAQLLGALLPALDEQTLASELLPTSEALERCRLDKVTVVRQAIGEALNISKSLASEVEHMLARSVSQEVPTPPRRSSDPRKRGRRRSLWRGEDRELSLSSKEQLSGSQESQLVSYAYSSSSSPPSLGSVSLASPATRIARSPLHPARQSPAMQPSSTERYTAESELEFILAHLKSSESKENAPLMGKPLETAPSVRSDGPINLSYGSKGSKDDGDDDEATGVSDDFSCDVEQERCGLFSDQHSELSHSNLPEADVRNITDEDTEAVWERKNSDDQPRAFPEASDEGSDRQESSDHPISRQFPEEESNGTIRRTQSSQEPDRLGHSTPITRYNSLAHLVNLEEVVSPQVSKTHMKPEDFLLFGTPRRLVRSLQSERSTPDSKWAPEGDSREGLEIDFEELSESGWSVRDNPIAGDTEEDSPRKGFLVDFLCKGNTNGTPDSNPTKGSTSDCVDDMVVPQAAGLPSFSEKDANWPVSADDSDLLLEADPGRGRRLLCVTDHVDLTGELHGTLLMQREKSFHPSTEITGDNFGEGKREIWALRWLRQRGARESTWFARRLSKVHHYIEMFLVGALWAVLFFTMAIAVINCLNGDEEIHVLVPT